MTFGVPFSIEMDTDEVKKWSSRLEYAPKVILSSIEHKLEAGQNPVDIKNLNTLRNWFENYFRFLNYVKKDLDENKSMQAKRKPPIYSQLNTTIHNILYKLNEIKADYPRLYSELENSHFSRIQEELGVDFTINSLEPMAQDVRGKSDTKIQNISVSQLPNPIQIPLNKQLENLDKEKLASLQSKPQTQTKTKNPVLVKLESKAKDLKESINSPNLSLKKKFNLETELAKVYVDHHKEVSKEQKPILLKIGNHTRHTSPQSISKVGSYSGKDAVFKGTITGNVVRIIAKYHNMDLFEGKTPMQKKVAYNHLLSYLSNNKKTRKILDNALRSYKIYKKGEESESGIILDEKNLEDPTQLRQNFYVYVPPEVLESPQLALALKDYDEDKNPNSLRTKRRITML